MPTSVMGFGTMYLGQRDYRREIPMLFFDGDAPYDASYVTTEFYTAFGLPLVPIESIRVVEMQTSGGPAFETSYRVLQRHRRLCWRQVAAIYATLALCIGSFAAFVAAMCTHKKPGPIYQYLNRSNFTWLILLCVLWPILVGGVLRVISKRRAGLGGIRSCLPF